MNIASTNLNKPLPDVPIESLAANQHLSGREKIAVASQQFEALLLKQVLAETQKPVIQSEFTDDSTAAGIYQDMISSQMANCLSKNDGIGLAKAFEHQLNREAGPGTQAHETSDTTVKSAIKANPGEAVAIVHPHDFFHK